MADRKQAIPIFHNKLHRPPAPTSVVYLKASHTLLDEADHYPLALVSAPAGYGKSTLVSHWLEVREGPDAWLSLAEESII